MFDGITDNVLYSAGSKTINYLASQNGFILLLIILLTLLVMVWLFIFISVYNLNMLNIKQSIIVTIVFTTVSAIIVILFVGVLFNIG
jgi:L-asparagine transporter-like permease